MRVLRGDQEVSKQNLDRRGPIRRVARKGGLQQDLGHEQQHQHEQAAGPNDGETQRHEARPGEPNGPRSELKIARHDEGADRKRK
jgi:hypothetical protein